MPDSREPVETVSAPLETATVLALGVFGLMILALALSWWIGDKELTRDLAKNFVGPAFLLIVGFYFGASSSGKRKDETIAKQLSEATK